MFNVTSARFENHRRLSAILHAIRINVELTSVDKIVVGVKNIARAVFLVTYLFGSMAHAASWIARVDGSNGLPSISKGGENALASEFVFWGAHAVWANQQTEFKIYAPFNYVVTGTNQALNLDIAGHITKISNRQLVWQFDLDSHSTTVNAYGGGVSFKFGLHVFGPELGEPDLLPENRGWIWGRAGHTRMEMRFDPPMASVYFERGQRSEIRAFFYKDVIPVGKRHYTATFSVSDDVEIRPTQAERFGLDDYSKWPTDILDWNASPVDLSFLNAGERPAGKHGFLKVQGEHLVFEDGTSVRFWGTNLTSYALFGTSKSGARQQARRLSALGFNLVRLVHHDSLWVDPNIFGDRNSPDTLHLSTAMLEKLDWWIKCLKDEGIYIWLDLHVERHLKAGDAIDNFEEISKGKSSVELRGYNYVNKSIQEAMKRFNEAYVTHRNAYTGLRYADEPAIMAMLLTNENDITHHFGNALLPDKDVPEHTARYMALASTFAETHGLPKDKVWRSWEDGPSKLFLNDLEHRFDADLMQHLRRLGVRVPIVTTSYWGNDPLSSLPALSTGDMIDAHAYGSVGELEKNPLYGPNMIDWLASARIAGKPFSVTEWNVEPFPVPDRHVLPLYVAGVSSLQGWNAVMQYAYAQVPLDGPGTPSNWHAFNDPALIAMLPAAALLFRSDHVKAADTTYALVPSTASLYDQPLSPATATALRTTAERGRLVVVLPETKELPWLEAGSIPPGAKILRSPGQSFISDQASEVISDTGELRRNWDEGIFTINSSRTQAAEGWVGGKNIGLNDVDLALTTRNASVAVQSLDDKPINQSATILISLGARSVPKTGGQLPFYSEPVEGQLIIRAREGLKLYKRTKTGEQMQQITANYSNGRYSVQLSPTLDTYWLFLKLPAQKSSR
jgi:hypothetical protein